MGAPLSILAKSKHVHLLSIFIYLPYISSCTTTLKMNSKNNPFFHENSFAGMKGVKTYITEVPIQDFTLMGGIGVVHVHE